MIGLVKGYRVRLIISVNPIMYQRCHVVQWYNVTTMLVVCAGDTMYSSGMVLQQPYRVDGVCSIFLRVDRSIN
jgi:hypothetical protein